MSSNYYPVLAVGLFRSEITREDIEDLIDNDTLTSFTGGDNDEDPVIGFKLYRGYQVIEDNGLIVFKIQKLKDQFEKITGQQAEVILCLDWY